MHRKMSWVALLAALGLIAAACTTADDGGAVSPPEFADLTGQRVQVAAVWSGTEQENFEAVLDLFEERTGANTRFVSTGTQIDAFLGGRIEGGSPPDVAILPNPGLLNDLAAAGNLIEVEDAAGELVDANYAPVWRELGSADGTLYGVWFKGSNKSTIWYNVNVFEDAGVTPPETWDDLLAAAGTIEEFGVPPFAMDGGSGWTLTDWFENVYIRTAGADLYDQLTSHDIPWTHESVIGALERLAEIWGNEAWLSGGRETALQTEFSGSVTRAWADPPEAAMVYEGDFVAGEITAQTDAQLGADANFFNFPSIDGSPPAVIGGGDVAVLLVDSEAGRELIKFLASPEAGEVWAGLGGFTSPNQNVDTSAYPDDITRSLAEGLAEAELFRFDLSDLAPGEFGGNTAFTDFQQFLRRPGNVQAAAERLERDAASAYG